MKKFQYFILIIPLFLFNSCFRKDTEFNKINSFQADSLYSVVKGDSLKIDFRRKGDTLFQRRTDLKYLKEGGFDNSFDVISVFSQRKTKEIITSKLTLAWNNVYLVFPKQELIDCAKNIANHNLPFFKGQKVINVIDDETLDEEKIDNTNEIIKKENTDIEVDTIVYLSPCIPLSFVQKVKFDAFFNNEHVDIVSIEEYKTSFSRGVKYYFLNIKKDTLVSIEVPLWIK